MVIQPCPFVSESQRPENEMAEIYKDIVPLAEEHYFSLAGGNQQKSLGFGMRLRPRRNSWCLQRMACGTTWEQIHMRLSGGRLLVGSASQGRSKTTF